MNVSENDFRAALIKVHTAFWSMICNLVGALYSINKDQNFQIFQPCLSLSVQTNDVKISEKSLNKMGKSARRQIVSYQMQITLHLPT